MKALWRGGGLKLKKNFAFNFCHNILWSVSHAKSGMLLDLKAYIIGEVAGY
jgi:hypothetical protein